MIDKLTPQQEAAIEVYRQRYLAYGLSTERLDRDRVTPLIHRMYARINLAAPDVRFCDSPKACYDAAKLADPKSKEDSMPLSFGGLDGYWVAFYDYLINELKLTVEQQLLNDFLLMREYTEYGGNIVAHKNVCWVSERPIAIRLDAEQRPHADGMLAVEYADGWGFYANHGLRLPKKYGAVPIKDWSAKWILDEKNEQIKGCLIDNIDRVRMLNELNAKFIDKYLEYSFYTIEGVDTEPIRLLFFICPSTSKNYCLQVPPDIISAQEAIRWINHGIDPVEFEVQT